MLHKSFHNKDTADSILAYSDTNDGNERYKLNRRFKIRLYNGTAI